jgi:nucleotide-binding universal stress UspA family protein
MYRKILYAHDGSEERAQQALPHLVALARGTGAEVVLCHVVSAPEAIDVPDTLDETVPSPSVSSNERLDAMADQLRAHGVDTVSTLVLDGEPAESIAAAAADLECDVVVMVTAGRSGLARFFSGSVADHVARNTPTAAVLLLRDEEG